VEGGGKSKKNLGEEKISNSKNIKKQKYPYTLLNRFIRTGGSQMKTGTASVKKSSECRFISVQTVRVTTKRGVLRIL